jgi:hypothetical protein
VTPQSCPARASVSRTQLIRFGRVPDIPVSGRKASDPEERA